MPNEKQWAAARARQAMYSELRRFFHGRGYTEVETPLLVGAAGMEPHIEPFRVPYVPETGIGAPRELFLHTSPEYAMKRLLADGCGPIFQLAKVFRNGEVSGAHNPEFTLLEFYRPHADYHAILDDLEAALAAVERAVAPEAGVFAAPFERLTVHQAVLAASGVDLWAHPNPSSLRAASERAGIRVGGGESWDDVFFHLFLQAVEPSLHRPTFLLEYPASMAALARLKPQDPRVAERAELFARGLELANGFSELTDATEQRARFEQERELRACTGRAPIPLDERFLDAVGKMPPSAGIAVGLDRVLMLLLGAAQIDEVLLFPARDFLEGT